MVNFKDLPDTSTPINASNLNKNSNELLRETKGVVLYENKVEGTETTGNLTLSDNITNYKRVKVFYSNNWALRDTVETDVMFLNNGTSFAVPLNIIYGASNGIVMKTATIWFQKNSPKTVSLDTTRGVQTILENNKVTNSYGNFITVQKIVGFKEA